MNRGFFEAEIDKIQVGSGSTSPEREGVTLGEGRSRRALPALGDHLSTEGVVDLVALLLFLTTSLLRMDVLTKHMKRLNDLPL